MKIIDPRTVETLKHIALSDLPPPPYLAAEEVGTRLGDRGLRVAIRVVLDNGACLEGHVVETAIKGTGAAFVLWAKVDLDNGDEIEVRAEWLS